MPIISEKVVEGLPVPEAGNKVHYFSGATLQGKRTPSGFGVRVTAAGAKSFVLFHRMDGKKYLVTLGRWGDLSVRAAIMAAQVRVKAVHKGADPRPNRTRRLDEANQPATKTVAGLLDMFMSRYVEGKLRSEKTIRQSLDRLVKPRIGTVGLYDMKRSQVSKMLDEIADENGEVMADRVLAYVRKAFGWYEVHGQDDDFRSPVVKGMARTKSSERARDRILTDDEIRALWKATGAPGPSGPLLRFILLTACRRSEAAQMTYSEIVDGDWVIPAARYKTKQETVLPLSKAAQDILNSIPRAKGTDFVFTATGAKPIAWFAQLKTAIDKECGFSDWTIHDLRRTARSLMSRAGVPADHAERCLGHVIGGVRGTYDRHEYLKEKRDGFERLAAIVDTILNPQSNVTPLPEGVMANHIAKIVAGSDQ
jgi:integrase